jgi:hypothetical protein
LLHANCNLRTRHAAIFCVGAGSVVRNGNFFLLEGGGGGCGAHTDFGD